MPTYHKQLQFEPQYHVWGACWNNSVSCVYVAKLHTWH